MALSNSITLPKTQLAQGLSWSFTRESILLDCYTYDKVMQPGEWLTENYIWQQAPLNKHVVIAMESIDGGNTG